MDVLGFICNGHEAPLRARNQSLQELLQKANTEKSRLTAERDTLLNSTLPDLRQRLKAAIDSSASPDEMQRLMDEIGALQEDKATIMIQMGTLQDRVNDLQALLAGSDPLDTHSIEFRRISPALRQTLISYENKYAQAVIRYPSRYVGTNPRDGIVFDVRAFAEAGKNTWDISKWLADHNCRVQDVLKDYPAKTYDQACEIAAVRVQARFPNPYETDARRWGRSEFWEFAPEVFCGLIQLGLGFDCDSHANCKHVMRRAAGIPDEMMNVDAGTTFTNDGHATNSMYFPSLGYFVHINSTSQCSDNDDIHQFARMGDGAHDPYNIKTHWFGYNAGSAHYEMVTDAQAREVAKRKRDRRPENRLINRAIITPVKKEARM